MKEWNELRYYLRRNKMPYKIMFEVRGSILLRKHDEYDTIFVMILRSSDKCIRAMVMFRDQRYRERQASVYRSFRAFQPLAVFLEDIANRINIQ